MKLCVIIPGFGDPHWDVKIEILRKNIATVSSFFQEYEFRIVQYTHDKDLPDDILDNPNILIIKDKGILGRNIHVHASPDSLPSDCDYVMILLDDVELLQPFDWDHMILVQKELELDIVSPALPDQSMTVWNWMLPSHDPSMIATVMTRLELFCYFMTPSAYATYYSFIDPENPWMWGMDFMVYTHMKLRCGLLHHITMAHQFVRTNDTHDPNHCPRKDSEKYLAKHKTTWHELHALPTVLQYATLRQ